jgi:hypothetical protein
VICACGHAETCAKTCLSSVYNAATDMLTSLSTPFFSSCLIGLPGSLVAISNFLRLQRGISHTKFNSPVGLDVFSSSTYRGMSCHAEMTLVSCSSITCCRNAHTAWQSRGDHDQIQFQSNMLLAFTTAAIEPVPADGTLVCPLHLQLLG